LSSPTESRSVTIQLSASDEAEQLISLPRSGSRIAYFLGAFSNAFCREFDTPSFEALMSSVNREIEGSEGTIGWLSDLVFLRVPKSYDFDSSRIIQMTQQSLAEAREWRQVPFAYAMKAASPDRQHHAIDAGSVFFHYFDSATYTDVLDEFDDSAPVIIGLGSGPPVTSGLTAVVSDSIRRVGITVEYLTREYNDGQIASLLERFGAEFEKLRCDPQSHSVRLSR
jgi:hypothetical protein